MIMGDQIAFFCLTQTMLFFLFLISFRFRSNSKDWFLDGTFKSSPFQFMQLYTVQVLRNHRNIVGAYELLPNKRKTRYVETLTKLQRLTHNTIPHSLITDFESSKLSALNQIYPWIVQLGCLFHLAKNALDMCKTLDYNRTTVRIHYLEVIFTWYLLLASFQLRT